MTEELAPYGTGIPRTLTLSQLNSAIREVLELTFPDTIWVIAEISEARCDSKGHCYLELVEKQDNRIIAKVRANIWSYSYRTISQRFEKATGQKIKAGIQVLLSVSVTFHEVYGLSLNIKDIDPTYSLGEMAKKKKETIERLSKEGLIDLNKSLPLPLVPQRIAIISSSTAAGYGDFINQIDSNAYGYRIYHELYQSIVQGDGAETSILESLSKIRKRIKHYDAVVIIRGGGSQLDLSCFDSYGLAAEIAKFPLPVITGIGHERDDTVADIVAHTKLKTPTAVAEFLLGGMRDFEDRLLYAQRRLAELAKETIKDEGHRLRYLAQSLQNLLNKLFSNEHRRLHIMSSGLRHAISNSIHINSNRLTLNKERLGANVRSLLQTQDSKLKHLELAVRLLDPINVLRRGYSITYHKNRAIKDAEGIKQGDVIITKLYDGSIKSTVEAKDGK